MLQYPSWLHPEIISGLPFRWYGLMYVVAFGITYLLVLYQVRQRWGKAKDALLDSLFFWCILGLLVGARLFGTLVYDRSGPYWQKPWLIFWPFDEGMRFTGFMGMSYHGGVLGLVVALAVFGRSRHLDLLEWGDMIAAAVPLGYTFGRLGNFINGELYGRATTSRLGMLFPYAQGLPMADPRVAGMARILGLEANGTDLVNLPRFPSQLFEAAFEGLVLWLFLWFVVRRIAKVKGVTLGAYIVDYGAIRFMIEYFREPDAGIGFPLALGDPNGPAYLFTSLFNFSTGQIFCFFMVLGGTIFLAVLAGKDRRNRL